MKKLGFRNKLVARPVSDVAPAGQHCAPHKLAPGECRLRNRRADLHLTPRTALAAILFVAAVALCEPSGLAGWIKALAAGVIVPGGTYAIVKTATGQWRAE